MKFLITGANGFVGHKLMENCKNALAAPSLRNATEDQVKRVIEESEAEVIIHTAAISDIPTCQKNPEASYIANVLLPVSLAKAAGGRKLICFSSDQVYSGCKEEGPYTEDNVDPANIYASHKLEMEQRVLEIDADAVMLRAEWMYDYIAPKGNYYLNILNAENMVSFSKRQYRGITYLQEVADVVENVVKLPGGSYNFGSETTQSMYDITRQFLCYIGKNISVQDTEPHHNLWMDCSKARKYGVVFSEVLDGLKKCHRDREDFR